jgi:NDP-sugar pyrophosphorylase family protein
MQTVVLAAGDGEGLEPVSASVPKPLLPVGGVPLLGRVLRRAVVAGASDVVVVVPPYCQPFVRALGDAVDGVPVTYAVQPRPTGTANALVSARRHLDDDFVVLSGDVLFDVADLEPLYETVPAVSVRACDERGGEPVVVGDGGPVDAAGLDDDPAGAYVDAGACSLPAEATGWTRLPPNDAGERDLASVVDRTAATYDVSPVVVDDRVDVDEPADLLAANRRAFDDWAAEGVGVIVDGTVDEFARLHAPVRVADGASVANGAVVEGPSVVDAGAVVEPNAYVGPYSYVGPDGTVGHSTRVANVVLLEGARIGPNCALEDSILGPGAEVCAGTAVANREHEPRTTVANREAEPGMPEDAPEGPTGRGDHSTRGSGEGFGVVVGGCATIEAGARVDTGVVVPRYATVDDDALRNDDSP